MRSHPHKGRKPDPRLWCVSGFLCLPSGTGVYSPESLSAHNCGFQAISLIALVFLSNLSQQRPSHHPWSQHTHTHYLSVHLNNVCVHVRKRVRAHNGIPWELSRMRNARERRECNTDSKDEMMDERHPAVCFKKGFFSPSFSFISSLK